MTFIKENGETITKEELEKQQVFYFHSNMNTELVTDHAQKEVIKLINKSLRLQLGESTKNAIRNILDQCETNKHRRMTVCGVINDDKLFIGVSVCSEHDNFSKKKGRSKAYHNAVTDPIDYLDNWKSRCVDQFNGSSSKTFISYCNEVAVPSYLNLEEYRKDKSVKKTIEVQKLEQELLEKSNQLKVEQERVSNRNWFKKLLNIK